MHSCPTGDGHSYAAVGLLLESISDLTPARHGPLPSWHILVFERWGAKPFANDLVEDRGVVTTGSVFSLRLVESRFQA